MRHLERGYKKLQFEVGNLMKGEERKPMMRMVLPLVASWIGITKKRHTAMFHDCVGSRMGTVLVQYNATFQDMTRNQQAVT